MTKYRHASLFDIGRLKEKIEHKVSDKQIIAFYNRNFYKVFNGITIHQSDSGRVNSFARGLELVWCRFKSKQSRQEAPFSSKIAECKQQKASKEKLLHIYLYKIIIKTVLWY